MTLCINFRFFLKKKFTRFRVTSFFKKVNEQLSLQRKDRKTKASVNVRVLAFDSEKAET